MHPAKQQSNVVVCRDGRTLVASHGQPQCGRPKCRRRTHAVESDEWFVDHLIGRTAYEFNHETRKMEATWFVMWFGYAFYTTGMFNVQLTFLFVDSWDLAWASWEPEKNILNLETLVQEFKRAALKEGKNPNDINVEIRLEEAMGAGRSVGP